MGSAPDLPTYPIMSRLHVNKATLAMSKSGFIEEHHLKSSALAKLSLSSCIFKSAAGFQGL